MKFKKLTHYRNPDEIINSHYGEISRETWQRNEIKRLNSDGKHSRIDFIEQQENGKINKLSAILLDYK